MEFTPLGLTKSFNATEYAGKDALGKDVYREKARLERVQQAVRATVGTIAMGTLLGMAMKNKDKAIPDLMVNGPGPANWQERNQYLAEGKLPFSIQLGNKFYSYKDTLAQVPLEIIGSIMDYVRNPKNDPSDWLKQVQIGAGAAVGVVANLSMFKTITDLTDAAKNYASDPDFSNKKILDALVVNPASGLIPFHGVARFFDNSPIDKYKDMWSSVISGVPYIEDIGGTRKSLNYFGEPISKNLEDRFGAFWGLGYASSNTQNVSPEWKWLAQNNYSLPQDQYISIHPVSPGSEDKYKRSLAKRSENLGAQYANLLTSDERYDLIQTAGPKIKALVNSYAQRYGNSGFNENVQRSLKKEVSQIFNETKKRMFIK